MPWRNFLRPKFGTKFQMKASTVIFEDTMNFLTTQCRTGGEKLARQKTARFVQPFR